jgi:tRNA(Ile)-lysidine synthase
MLKKVKQHINKHQLLDSNDHILVTLSGGADSMALLKILTDLNYKIGVAHCNFKLRGAESDADEKFVHDWVEKLAIPVHFISFDTKAYAKSMKLSIEMAARELRYNWFEDICQQHGYTKIATGHHLNDSIETVFLNLARGTGIQGITGIQAKNGNIIRPLLTLSRYEIDKFLQQKHIPYRHDSSNDSLEYLRNIVRHEIIPAFKKLNSGFESVMAQNLENLSQAQGIYQQNIATIRNEITQKVADRFIIDSKKLVTNPFNETILYELVKDFGFAPSTVQKAIRAIEAEPGRIFYADKYQLLVDRDTLIIELQAETNDTLIVNSMQELEDLPFFQVHCVSAHEYALIKSVQTGSFDLDKINFPITIRSWQTGDKFYPLGMQHPKKVSDFFTDLKIDRFKKEKIRIMECAEKIIWVVGYRIDDRFKVTKNTKKVLVINIQS